MTTTEIKTKVSEILKCKVEKITTRVFGLGLGDTCKRCGGTGEHSFNPMYGTTCFSCNGTGQNISETPSGWKRIYAKAQELPSETIDAYLEDLRNKATAKNAHKTLMDSWKEANVRVGMQNHHLKQSPEHSAFNEAIAPFSNKLMMLSYVKDSHNQILDVLKEGLLVISAKEKELFS
jgi:hypothetical protein